MIRTRSTARIFLVCIYLVLNYFINHKFPALKQSVFLLNRKCSKMWHGSKVLWNKGSRGWKFHKSFVPGDKSSTLWNFRSWYRYNGKTQRTQNSTLLLFSLFFHFTIYSTLLQLPVPDDSASQSYLSSCDAQWCPKVQSIFKRVYRGSHWSHHRHHQPISSSYQLNKQVEQSGEFISIKWMFSHFWT